jgi:hypothetical protein
MQYTKPVYNGLVAFANECKSLVFIERARGGMADTPDLGFFLDRFFGFLGLTLRIHKTIAT